MNATISKTAQHHIHGTRQRYEHLDMIRGLAALLVLAGHARGLALVDFSAAGSGRLLLAPFYIITSLGHQAVVIFFALSGFLVGGPALREIAQRRWRPADYAIHRFTRLWTTLIPALAATFLLDGLGRDLLGLKGYAGEYWPLLIVGPMSGQHISLSFTDFLGNIAFLQTILVPTFGTNAPLWSLANEFWYYFLVPFAWLALRGGVALPWRLAAAALSVSGCLLLPYEMLQLGVIWIYGALAFFAVDWMRAQAPNRRRVLLLLALLASAGGLALSLWRPSLNQDLVFGLGCAASLPCLAAASNPGGLYGRMSFALSEISFTLYVVHFPLLALLWFGLFAPTQYPLAGMGLLVWLGLIVAALGYATAMWWLFERNTGAVRRKLTRMLLRT